MKLLFVADPLETFKTYKDTTFAMMRAASARGHALHACEPKDLVWERGGRVSARVRTIALAAPSSAAWFVETAGPASIALADADAVVMRKDPPFDSEYFYATHLLSQAEREGARVFNSPRALREHPEKLAILEFPQYIAPTIQLLLGVWLYREPFDASRLAGFAMIWTALGIYSAEGWWTLRRRTATVALPAV